MTIIETQDLAKSFRVRGKLIEAVKGIDIQVHEGELFGFLGPNGAGKTTTMRMLTTLLAPSGGRATIVGCDLRREPRRVRQQIGYVSQIGGTHGNCTGRENLVLQGRLCGQTHAHARARATELLTTLDLASIADRRAVTYSGGQRRKLDLAMGMMHRPVLLFLDEPTTGLDPQSRNQLWDELRKLQNNGTTVFMTTHYLDEADALCQRLAIIDGGRVVVEGTPDDLKRQISGDTVTLGVELSPSDRERLHELLRSQSYVQNVSDIDAGFSLQVARGEEAMPLLLRLVDEAGLRIGTISLRRPTLNDVFLRQTGQLFDAPGREPIKAAAYNEAWS